MPKLAKNIGRAKNNLAANEVRHHGLRCPGFSSFVGRVEVLGFLLFPICSQMKGDVLYFKSSQFMPLPY
jgi:hypothetical protein